MNFEDKLLNGLPTKEAATFFISLKNFGQKEKVATRADLQAAWDSLSMEQIFELAKEGMGNMGVPQPPPVANNPAAMGKLMPAAPAPALPPAGMGQHKVATPNPHLTNARYTFANHALGAGLGVAAGAGLGSHLERKKHEKEHGEHKHASKEEKSSHETGKERAHTNLSAEFEKDKHHGHEDRRGLIGRIGGAATGGLAAHHLGKGNILGTIGGAALGSHLGGKAGEHSGRSVDREKWEKHASALKLAFDEMTGGKSPDVPDMESYVANEREGLAAEEQMQAEFLRQKLQEAQQQLQMQQQSSMSAEQQLQTLQQQQQQHEQQMQASQQAAQLAQEAAMQNVQHAHEMAMQATSQTLQAKDEALSTHQLAAQMRMAYQDLRGNIMDSVAQDNAAPIGEAIKAQGQPQPDPSMAPQEMGEQESGPAGQAQGAAAAPTAAPPEGEAHANQANSEGATDATLAQPSKEQGMKQAGADWSSVMHHAMGHLRDRLPYMAVGAGAGAALPLVESQVGHDDLREKVKRLEGEQAPGSFGKAIDLAQSKMRLALGEISEQHPVGASLAGAGLGAMFGAASGPGIMKAMKNIPDHIGQIRHPGQ